MSLFIIALDSFNQIVERLRLTIRFGSLILYVQGVVSTRVHTEENGMKFEFNSDGFDGLLDDLKTFEIDCPECDHPIEVSLDDIGSVVKCPQCGADIKLESE